MHETALLRASVERIVATIERLTDDQLRAASRLPGWTRAHVASHLARSSDSRVRLLAAAREGTIGEQYPSEEARAADIEAGAARAAEAVRADARASLERLLGEVERYPPDRWDAPGRWLGGEESPVHRVVPSMRREVEYHHVDLDAGYGPGDWPADFVEAQLRDVVATMSERAQAPAVTLALAGERLRIRDGGRGSVTGEPSDLLGWLTGRATGDRLRMMPPGPLPAVPPLS